MPPPMMSVSTFIEQVADDADLIGNLLHRREWPQTDASVWRAAHHGNF